MEAEIGAGAMFGWSYAAAGEAASDAATVAPRQVFQASASEVEAPSGTAAAPWPVTQADAGEATTEPAALAPRQFFRAGAGEAGDPSGTSVAP